MNNNLHKKFVINNNAQLLILIVFMVLAIILGEYIHNIFFTLGIFVSVLIYYIFSNRDIFNPIAVISIVWIGCISLEQLKLTYDQSNWSFFVWINVILAYIMFLLGYFIYYLAIKKSRVTIKSIYKISDKRLLFCIKILFSICIFSFIFEVFKLKFIPIFSTQMSAYQDFHISGIHYITVSIALIPALSVLYKSIGGKSKIIYPASIISVIVPLLMVSRQLIIFEFIMLIITFNYCIKKISKKQILIFSILCIILFSIGSNLRHQNLDYIYSVANLKINRKTILIQPYLYLTMSFENLRNLITNCNTFEYGKNVFFPIVAFSNLKETFSYNSSMYLTNPMFNVSTYLFPVYLDFGVIGIIIYNVLFGFIVSGLYYSFINSYSKKISILIFAIISYSLIFCFFINWLSNTSIIFYIIILVIIDKVSFVKLTK